MSDETKKLEINDILNLIETVNKSLDSEAYVPSQEKPIKIKTLNANHTKNILKSAMDGAFAANQFNLIIHQILKEVVDHPLGSLTTLDKMFLLLQLRIKNVSDEIEIELTSDKGEKIKQKLNLNKLLNKLKKETFSFTNEVIESDKITVQLAYPSIEDEYQFEHNLFKTKIANIDEKNEKAIRSLFAPMFINNVAQFVTSININGTDINMKTKNINERLLIVEKLPAVIDKIINKIDTVFGKQLSKITNIEITRDDVVYNGVLNLDASFFIG